MAEMECNTKKLVSKVDQVGFEQSLVPFMDIPLNVNGVVSLGKLALLRSWVQISTRHVFIDLVNYGFILSSFLVGVG